MNFIDILYRIKHFIPSKINKIKNKYFSINHPDTFILSDRFFIEKFYKKKTGLTIDLKKPVLLNEKLQWLKLYDRNPIYTVMSDKWAVRDLISRAVGPEYCVPLIGDYYNDADEIDFSKLPDKYVLKCNHVSDVIIVKNGIAKSKSGIVFQSEDEIRSFLNKQLKVNYFYKSREWSYKDIKPKILIETFLENEDKSELADYKFYSYGGKVRYFMYSLGEGEHNVRNHKFNVDLNSIDHLFKKVPAINENDIRLPQNIKEMISIAESICKDYQHLRVDMYNIDGKIYIGEITLYTSGGFIQIDDENYARQLADYIDISKVKIIK